MIQGSKVTVFKKYDKYDLISKCYAFLVKF